MQDLRLSTPCLALAAAWTAGFPARAADNGVAALDPEPVATPGQLSGGSPPPDSALWNWHAQATFIGDLHPAFSTRFPDGPNSMHSSFERQETLSMDLTAGVKVWAGAEFHVDGLLWQGFGFTKTLGAEAFPNAEAYRLGTQYPNVNFCRVFVRQVIGLGGETELIPEDPLHVGGPVDASRIIVTAGKMSVLDVFDGNTYAASPRTQFQNWALVGNEAWDYPADSIGYMTGIAAEWREPSWSLRYGFFQMPKEANGVAVDQSYTRAWGMPLESEYRFTVNSHPGAVRFLTYLNRARMGSYEAVADDPALTIVDTRAYRMKYGFALNAEQEIYRGVGVFARVGWSDGHTEAWAYSDVDQAVSGGVSVKGEHWNRPDDTFGLAAVFDAISSIHQRFFSVGGTGILAGDGYLNYGIEKTMEVYYDFAIYKALHGAADFQFIADPAFNRDRGPVEAIGMRLHWEY